MGLTWSRQTPVPREFECKMCGRWVYVDEPEDRRTVFCCEDCEQRYWKHHSDFERTKNIAQGFVIQGWQLAGWGKW